MMKTTKGYSTTKPREKKMEYPPCKFGIYRIISCISKWQVATTEIGTELKLNQICSLIFEDTAQMLDMIMGTSFQAKQNVWYRLA